jgi:hypothetical protein
VRTFLVSQKITFLVRLAVGDEALRCVLSCLAKAGFRPTRAKLSPVAGSQNACVARVDTFADAIHHEVCVEILSALEAMEEVQAAQIDESAG